MLVSKVNKKEIIKNIVVLAVLLALIVFVVFKYIIPEDKKESDSMYTSEGININELLDVQTVKPKELEVDVLESDKYLILKSPVIKRTRLEDLKKGKTELFPFKLE